MPNRFKEAAKKARNATNAKYASEISSLTRLTDNEIAKLFPARADKERLMELLAVVNDATSENQKISKLTKNIEYLAPAAIKLIKHLV